MALKEKQFKKRNAILSCLQQTHSHPSAEMVLELLKEEHPDISLATVYRNLTWFKNQGLITSLGTVNGVERFDYNIEPHVHFICSQCHSVLDLPGVEPPVSLNEAVQRGYGCQVSSCQLSFSGLCQNCQNP